MSVNIHGKEYITVAERVKAVHEDLDILSITTEVLPNGGSVVIKATVITPKGTFTGISAANPNKLIEKQSPYEVAETSAVGRALGFAGYGIIEGIATADEMVKVMVKVDETTEAEEKKEEVGDICPKCKEGKLIARTSKTGKTFLKCENGGWDSEKGIPFGCDYVNWRNPLVPKYDKRQPYDGETIPVEEYDK